MVGLFIYSVARLSVAVIYLLSNREKAKKLVGNACVCANSFRIKEKNETGSDA